jgi:oxygen-dependent protoporphyrinogen oxidase
VLPDTLAATLKEQLVCNAPLRELGRTRDGYRLSFDAGRAAYDCDIAVVASQACDAWQPLQALDPQLSAVLQQFEYAPVAVVGLGFEQDRLPRKLDGFGFLVPGEEPRKILGSLWTSCIFAHRAPPGSVLLRTLIGGARAPALAALPEEQLVQLARAELSIVLGIQAPPVFVQVFKWPQAICQYTPGHRERLTTIEQRLAVLPGLFLAGNAYRGVALNDCTHNATVIADQVADYLHRTN